MANIDHKIGSHRFALLLGNWSPPRLVLERDQRPGTDGTEHTKTGTKGRPFTLRSITDVDDYADGLKTYRKYLETIGKDPVEVIVNQVKSTDHDFKVQVENVELESCRAAAIVVGGRKKDSEAILICRWQLVAVKDD